MYQERYNELQARFHGDDGAMWKGGAFQERQCDTCTKENKRECCLWESAAASFNWHMEWRMKEIERFLYLKKKNRLESYQKRPWMMPNFIRMSLSNREVCCNLTTALSQTTNMWRQWNKQKSITIQWMLCIFLFKMHRHLIPLKYVLSRTYIFALQEAYIQVLTPQ